MVKRITINDNDREQWVQNDEGLCRWWRGSGLSLRKFIRENREELTEFIMGVLNAPDANERRTASTY